MDWHIIIMFVFEGYDKVLPRNTIKSRLITSNCVRCQSNNNNSEEKSNLQFPTIKNI